MEEKNCEPKMTWFLKSENHSFNNKRWRMHKLKPTNFHISNLQKGWREMYLRLLMGDTLHYISNTWQSSFQRLQHSNKLVHGMILKRKKKYIGMYFDNFVFSSCLLNSVHIRLSRKQEMLRKHIRRNKLVWLNQRGRR